MNFSSDGEKRSELHQEGVREECERDREKEARERTIRESLRKSCGARGRDEQRERENEEERGKEEER